LLIRKKKKKKRKNKYIKEVKKEIKSEIKYTKSKIENNYWLSILIIYWD